MKIGGFFSSDIPGWVGDRNPVTRIPDATSFASMTETLSNILDSGKKVMKYEAEPDVFRPDQTKMVEATQNAVAEDLEHEGRNIRNDISDMIIEKARDIRAEEEQVLSKNMLVNWIVGLRALSFTYLIVSPDDC